MPTIEEFLSSKDISDPQNQTPSSTGDGFSEPVDDPKPLTTKEFLESYDPSIVSGQQTYTSNIDVAEFAPYMRGVDTQIGDILDRRARGQGFFERSGSSTARTLGYIVGDIVSSAGYILNTPDLIFEADDSEEKWTNALVELGNSIREGSDEAFPVYVEKGIEGSFKPWSPQWWALYGPSLGSTAALLIPGLAAAKGAGLAAKGLSLATRGRELSALANLTVESIGGGLISRHVENSMESYQAYTQKYDERKKLGDSDQAARLAADEVAANVYGWNYINLLTDIPQYALIGKGVNFANRGLSNTLKKVSLQDLNQESLLYKVASFAKAKPGSLSNADFAKFGGKYAIAKEFAKQSGSEGFEEVFQAFISTESSAHVDKKINPDKVKDFSERLNDFFSDPETWNAAWLGAVGGGVFGVGARALTEKLSKSEIQAKADKLNNLIARGESIRNTLDAAAKLSALGDEVTAQSMIDGVVLNLSLNAANRGEIGLEKGMFETISKLSDEQLESLGWTEDARQNATNALQIVNDVENVYNKWSAKDWNDVSDEHRPFIPFLTTYLTKSEIESVLAETRGAKLEQKATEREAIRRDVYQDQFADPDLTGFFKDKKIDVLDGDYTVSFKTSPSDSKGSFEVYNNKTKQTVSGRSRNYRAAIDEFISNFEELGVSLPTTVKPKDIRKFVQDTYTESKVEEALENDASVNLLKQGAESARTHARDLRRIVNQLQDDPEKRKEFFETNIKSYKEQAEAQQNEASRQEEEQEINDKITQTAQERRSERVQSEPIATKQQFMKGAIPTAPTEDIGEVVETPEYISDEDYRLAGLPEEESSRKATGKPPVKKPAKKIDELDFLDDPEELRKRAKERALDPKFQIPTPVEESTYEDQHIPPEEGQYADVISSDDVTYSKKATKENVKGVSRNKSEDIPVEEEREVDSEKASATEAQPEITLFKVAYRSTEDDFTPNSSALIEFLHDPNSKVEGSTIEFSVDREYVESIFSPEIIVEFKKRTPIVKKGKNYFIGKYKINIGKLPVKFVVLDKNNTPVNINGENVEGYIHSADFKSEKIKFPQHERERLTDIKARIYNVIIAGGTARTILTRRSNGSILKDSTRNPESKFELAERNSIPILLEQIGQENAPIGVSDDSNLPGNVKNQDGILAPGFSQVPGRIYIVLDSIIGTKVPVKLNQRNLRLHEAELVYDCYVALMQGKRFTSILESDIVEGLTIGQILNILVEEGSVTDRFADDTERVDRVLKYSGSKVYYGSNVANKRQFLSKEGKEKFIAHIRAHKYHNVASRNLGKGNTFATLEGVESFKLFGKNYTAQKENSYREYLFDNGVITTDIPLKYSDGTPVTRAFVDPIVDWDTNVQYTGVAEPLKTKTREVKPKAKVKPKVSVKPKAPQLSYTKDQFLRLSSAKAFFEADFNPAKLVGKTINIRGYKFKGAGVVTLVSAGNNLANNESYIEVRLDNGQRKKLYFGKKYEIQTLREKTPRKPTEKEVKEVAKEGEKALAKRAIEDFESVSFGEAVEESSITIGEEAPPVEERGAKVIVDTEESIAEEASYDYELEDDGGETISDLQREARADDAYDAAEQLKEQLINSSELLKQFNLHPSDVRWVVNNLIDEFGEINSDILDVEIRNAKENTENEDDRHTQILVYNALKILLSSQKKESFQDKLKKAGLKDLERSDKTEDPDEYYRLANYRPTEAERINLEQEIEWIRSVLPANIDIEVVEDLIRVKNKLGDKAFGAFSEGLIRLSKFAASGTGYHEAFHAVFRTYLTPEQQQVILEEAREVYGKELTDKELEDRLAEDFRIYIQSKGKVKFPAKRTEGFFRRIFNLIKSVFSRKLTVNSLFKKIANAEYKQATPIDKTVANFKDQIAYREIPEGFTDEEFDEVVGFLIYRAIKVDANGKERFSITVDEVDQIDTSVLEPALISIREGLMRKEDPEDIPMIVKYTKILDNMDMFIKGVEDFLGELGIKRKNVVDTQEDPTTSDDPESEDSKSGGLNINPPFEYSGKHTATANTILFVALQKDEDNIGPYLGRPTLVDFSSTWAILESNLKNIVDVPIDGKTVSTWEQMLSRLEEIGKANPIISRIHKQLLALPENRATEFYIAFKLSSQNFLNFRIDSSKKGIEFKASPAVFQSTARRLREEWNSDFLNSSIFKDNGSIDKGYVNSLKKRMQDLVKDFGETLKAKQDVKTRHVKELISILSDSGIEIDEDSMRYYLGANYNEAFRNLLTALSRVYIKPSSRSRASLQTAKSREEYENTRVTPVLNERIFLDIAEAYVVANNINDGESTVFGPENKPYWTNSSPNLIHDIVNRIKASPEYLQQLIELFPYSDWLQLLKDPDIRARFNYATYLNFQTGLRDKGSKWSDIETPDKIVMQINAVLRGINSTLNMADKTVKTFIAGIPLEKQTTFLTDGNIDFNPKILTLFANYFLAEHNRVAKSIEQKKNRNIDTIDYLHDSGILLFTNLAPENLQISNEELFNVLYHPDGTPKTVLPKDITNILKPEIRKILTLRVKSQLQQLMSYDFLRYKDGRFKVAENFVSKEVWDNYLNAANKHTTDAVVHVVGDYVINAMKSNFEQSMIFHGGYGAYQKKSSNLGELDDLRKRTSAAQAFGKTGRIDLVNKTYKVIALADVKKKKSPYYDAILSTLERLTNDKKLAKEIADPYSDVNVTDAQSLVTLPRYRDLLRMFGKWNEEYESAFQRFQNGESNLADVKLFLEPIKGVHIEVLNHRGLPRPVYLKFSEAPLIPALIKGSPLEELNNRMLAEGIDEAVFESGFKVGATKSKVNINKLPKKFVTTELSNTHWRWQVEVPHHGVSNTLWGSQGKKIIQTNVDPEAEYSLGKGSDLLQELHDAQRTLSNRGKETLFKDMGINPETLEFETDEELYNLLIAELEKRDIPENAFEFLQLDGDSKRFVISLSASPYSETIQNVFFALVNDRNIKLKLSGGSAVQVSSAIVSKELLPPREENGEIKVGQVLVPQDWFPFAKTIDDVPENLRKIMAYRIPTQSKASIDILEVVGFIPKEAGDSIIIYDEITAKWGADFDIDKAYFVMPSWKKTKSGKIKKNDFITGDTSTDEGLRAIYDKKYEPLKYAYRQLIDKIKTEKNTFVENEQAVAQFLDEILPIVEDIDYIEDIKDAIKKKDAQRIRAKVEAIPKLKDFIEQYKGKSIYELNHKGAITNRVIDVYESIMTSENNFVEWISPTDAPSKRLKDIADLFPDPIDYSNAFEFSPENQLNLGQIFTEGKDLIGLIANHSTDHALAQQAGMYLPTLPGFDTNKHPEMHTTDVSQFVDVNDYLISYSISALMNASVDIAKDPYIFRLNMNLFTGNMGLMLIRAGADPLSVFAFLNQPIIKDLIKQNSLYESKVHKKYRREPYDVVWDKWARVGKKHPKAEAVKRIGKISRKNIFSSKTLLSQIRNNPAIAAETATDILTTDAFRDQQVIYLETFKELQDMAREFGDSVIASKSDVGGLKNIADAIARRNLLRKVRNSEVVGGFENKFNNTALEVFTENSVDLTVGDKNITESVFIESSPAFLSVLDNISVLINKPYITKTEIIETIFKEAYTYTFSNSSLNIEEKKELFYGKNTPAHRLQRLKRSSEFKDNALVKFLNYNISGDPEAPSFIRANGNKKNKYQANRLTRAWKDLADNPKTRDFALTLAKLAYVQSGMRNGLYTFYDLIPYSIYEDLQMFDFFKSLKLDTDTLRDPNYLNGFINQFFRHNHHDDVFVPRIPTLKMAYDIGSNEDTFTLDGEQDDVAKYVIGTDQEDRKVYRPYLKRVIGDVSTLYVLIGYNKNDHPVYKKTSKLGYFEKGDRIYEYQFDGTSRTVVTKNQERNVKDIDRSKLRPPTSVTTPFEATSSGTSKIKRTNNEKNQDKGDDEVTKAKKRRNDRTKGDDCK